MKTLVMALKLFKKHLVLNLLIIIELALVTVVAVIASDMIKSSTACITTLQNSCDRIMYCINPSGFSDDESDSDNGVGALENAILSGKKFQSNLKSLTKNFKFIKGYSHFVNSYITFDKNTFKTKEFKINNCADVIAVDNETARAVHYPLADGKWFTAKLLDGCVPCVVGGTFSGNYKIGQKITGYTNADNKGKKAKRINFVVTGRLAKPEQVLMTNYSTNDTSMAASELFQSRIDEPLLMIAPSSLTGYIVTMSAGAGDVFMYLDGSATKSQIMALRRKLTLNYTFTDDQLVANERKKLAQSVSIIMPFIIMLLLVSFCGVVSMCMLTTLRNMETFKLYYLTGCPRYKTVVVTGIYSLFYFIGAGLVFFAAMNYFYTHTNDLMTKANFIVYPQMLLLIGVCVVLVCLLSFVIPFFILRRQKPADLLREN
jgi:hypothetical protein